MYGNAESIPKTCLRKRTTFVKKKNGKKSKQWKQGMKATRQSRKKIQLRQLYLDLNELLNKHTKYQ